MSADSISNDLRVVLRRLKLSRLLDTLPERLALARQQKVPQHDFLLLVLQDEAMRRDGQAATLRAQKARLNPKAQLEARDSTAKVTLDHALLNELAARSSKLADQAPLGPSKSGARDTVSDAAPPWWPDLPGPRMTGLMVSTVG